MSDGEGQLKKIKKETKEKKEKKEKKKEKKKKKGSSKIKEYRHRRIKKRELRELGRQAFESCLFKDVKSLEQLLKFRQEEKWEDVATRQKVLEWMDDVGRSPLHAACMSGALECVKVLIECECSVFDVDIFGNTPLHMAVGNGHLHLSDILLDNGASFDVANKKGLTPMDMLQAYDQGENCFADEPSLDHGYVTPSSFRHSHEGEKLNEEEAWAEKLAAELSDRDTFEHQWGQHAKEVGDAIEEEAMEDWRRHVAKEMNKKRMLHARQDAEKRRKMADADAAECEAREEKWRKLLEEEKKRDAEWRASVLNKTKSKSWGDYVQSYERMERKKADAGDASLSLSYDDVPWPPHDESNHYKFPHGEGGAEQLGDVDVKRILRREQMRWHPDKFNLHWGSHIRPEDVERCKEKVHSIMQALNDLWETKCGKG